MRYGSQLALLGGDRESSNAFLFAFPLGSNSNALRTPSSSYEIRTGSTDGTRREFYEWKGGQLPLSDHM
jgi:hypothetical protein